MSVWLAKLWGASFIKQTDISPYFAPVEMEKFDEIESLGRRSRAGTAH